MIWPFVHILKNGAFGNSCQVEDFQKNFCVHGKLEFLGFLTSSFFGAMFVCATAADNSEFRFRQNQNSASLYRCSRTLFFF